MINVYDRNGAALGSFINDVPDGCPYFEDKFTEDSLTQQVSLEFEVPLGRAESKWLDAFSKVTIKDSDGDLRLFNVTNTYEDWNKGQAVKRVYAEDVATTELNQSYTQPFRATRLEDALNSALQESPWEYELEYSASLSEDMALEITDYTKTKGVLTQIMEAFEVSMKFTAVTGMFGISKRVIKVFSNKGNVTGKYFYYDRDLQGLTRSVEYSDVKTAVIPIGKDAVGNFVKINDWMPTTPVQGFHKEFTWDFIVDEKAQETYGDITTDYRYVLYQNNAMADKTLLYYNAINELKKVNAPVYTYNLSVLLLEKATGIQGEEVRLGDVVWFKDSIGAVEIGIEARVVRLEKSQTNPDNDLVQFSNFREISVMDSQDVEDLRKQLEQLGNTVTEQGETITQLSAAQEGILTSLDGKSSISIGPTPNPSPQIGDTWFEPAKDSKGRDTVRIRTWNGTEWASQFDSETVNQVSDATDQAQEDASQAITDANTAVDKANAAAAEAKKAIDGQGNLVNNFSISGNFDRWNTGSFGGLVMQTVPFLNGQTVKALYSSGEANQIYRSVRQKLDPTKMYEVSVWVLAENDLNNFYFGLETDGPVTRVNKITGQSAAGDTNPYYVLASKAPITWTKYTGYFAPNGTDPLTLRDAGGNNINNFIQTQTNNSFSLRVLNYPTTMPRKMWIANPSIFEVNPDQMNRNASFKVGMEAISATVSTKANQADLTILSNQVTTTVTELNQVQAGRNFQRDIQIGYTADKTTVTKNGVRSLTIRFDTPSSTAPAIYLRDLPELVNGVTYTLKAQAILTAATEASRVLRMGVRNTGTADFNVSVFKTGYTPISFTFKYVKSATAARIVFFDSNGIALNPATVVLGDVSITEGTVPPAQWFPSFLDYASQSQITQLSDSINLRVEKDKIINQINVSTEGILIAGVKTHITGLTTIEEAVIKSAMIDSMTASKLTAGTIDAGVINVVNLNAAELKSGIIQGIDIRGTTITNNFNYTEAGSNIVGTATLAQNKLLFEYGLAGTNTTGKFDISPMAINSTIFSSGAFQSGWEMSGSGFNTVTGNPSSGGSSLALGMNGINVMNNGNGTQYVFGGEGLSIRPTVGTSTTNTSLELYGLISYMDMHSNNQTNDYGVRFRATGGSSANGSSLLTMYASQFDFNGTNGGLTLNGPNISVNDHMFARVPAFATLGCATNAGVWRPMRASAFDVQSDREEKKNIEPLVNALDKVMGTPIYNYNRSDEYDWEIKHTGMMLQEAPLDVVSPNGSVDVYGVASLALGGLQELKQEKDAEIASLKDEVAALYAMVQTLVKQSDQ